MHLSLVLSGFISLDCGISKDSDYIDQKISINYISDESFVEKIAYQHAILRALFE